MFHIRRESYKTPPGQEAAAAWMAPFPKPPARDPGAGPSSAAAPNAEEPESRAQRMIEPNFWSDDDLDREDRDCFIVAARPATGKIEAIEVGHDDDSDEGSVQAEWTFGWDICKKEAYRQITFNDGTTAGHRAAIEQSSL